MIRNQYWDLFECRWVTYHPADAAKPVAETVPAPRAAKDAAQVESLQPADAAVRG